MKISPLPQRPGHIAKALCVLCILLPLYLFISLPSFAATWQLYPFTDTYQRLCRLADDLYILKSNQLFQASIHDWQVTRQLTRNEGLSGTHIVDICQSDEHNCLVIIYDDGTIDLLRSDGSISTIPDLANTPMPGTDKSIRSAREQEGLLFVTTSYGFLVADLGKRLILHSFDLGLSPLCAWSCNDHWYYSTAQGIYACAHSANAYAPNAWRCVDQHGVDQALVFWRNGKRQCWLHGCDKTLRQQRSDGTTTSLTSNVLSIHRAGRYVLAATSDSLYSYDAELHKTPLVGQQPLRERLIDATSLSSPGHQQAYLYTTQGIVSTQHETPLQVTNRQQDKEINRLMMDASGQIAMSRATNANDSYSAMTRATGFLSLYQPATDQWTNYQQMVPDRLAQWRDICAISDICADPVVPMRYYFSCLEDGVVIVQDGELLRQYSHHNSGLTSYVGITRVGSSAIDADGNLWCTNEGVTNILAVLTAQDSIWHTFRIPGLEKGFGYRHFLVTRQADRHQVWCYQEKNYLATNLFCYEYGPDIANTDDDRCVVFKELTPDVGTPFTPYYGRGIYEAPSGAIWLLNTSGLYVIDSPDQVFAQPGQVRTVLTDVIPHALAFDDQQRIWVSTEGKGLYLLSPDGRKQLAHYTTANSLLPSDDVSALVFDSRHSTLWLSTTNRYVASLQYEPYEFGSQETFTSSAFAWCSDQTVTILNVQDGSHITIQNSQGYPVIQTRACGGLLHLDASLFPIDHYTVIGTDSEGHRGTIASFSIEER